MQITQDLTKGWVQGRNGMFDLSQLILWEINEKEIWIQGVSKRGKTINGGFGAIPKEELLQLCESYLSRNGYTVYETPSDFDSVYTDIENEHGDNEAFMQVVADRLRLIGDEGVAALAKQLSKADGSEQRYFVVQDILHNWDLDPDDYEEDDSE